MMNTIMKVRNAPLPYLLGSAALILVAYAIFSFYNKQTRSEKISQFGKYQGYAQNLYDGRVRTSAYLTLANGTRLAYDLHLPTQNGQPAGKALPVLFKYTPYSRNWTVFNKAGENQLSKLVTLPWYYDPMLRFASWISGKSKTLDDVDRTEWLGGMIKSGYAVVVVDRPGTGASFGKMNFEPSLGAREADEILNWIADQPWCDGNIGMYGDSIQAQIQFLAASTHNPHLKAILPATTWMDNYSAIMFAGGVRNIAFQNFYVRANRVFDNLATPVDTDTDGSLLAQALEERKGNSLADYVASMPEISFRDLKTTSGAPYWEKYQSLYPYLDKINQSGIPVYLIDGWYDIYSRDDFLIYNNLSVPKRMLIRPTDHSNIESPGSDVDYAAEAQRWFDYWLKGIDNGIMEEAPIHYYVQEKGGQNAYQSASTWPVPEAASSRYYFGAGNGEQKESVNNGLLTLEAQATDSAYDAYTVDYTTTSGSKPRWSAPAEPHEYPDMRANDAKGLTYTTGPLEQAVQVTGHPVVHLWLCSQAPDLDAFVYLEQVDAKGSSTYITEGNLRASHRALGTAPFDNFGLPWHNHYESELAPIPAGEPIELVFDLLPTSYQFAPGNRIRITVVFADANNFDTPVLSPAPALQLLRDARHSSYVDLPVMKP